MSEHEMVRIELPWPNESSDSVPNRKNLDIGVRAVDDQLVSESGDMPDLGGIDRIPLEFFFYPPDDSNEYTLSDMHYRCLDYLNGICLMLDINDRVFAPQLQDWGEVVKGGRVLVVIGGDIIPQMSIDALDHYEDLFTQRTATGAR